MSADVQVPVEGHAAEQEYFDAAREVREEKRSVRAGAASAGGDSKAALRLARDGDGLGHPGDAVAFAKLVTTDGRDYYVGKHDISHGADTHVYSWRVPAIMKMREATAAAPGDIERQRQFVTDGNTILDFEDQVFAQIAQELERVEDLDTEVIRGDAMLDGELARERSPRMRQIVQTIQALQSRVIRTPLDRLLVIQGGPGTGKTAVALHRVAYLLYNESTRLSPTDVLVVGPNRTFVRYINHVLPDLGDEAVRQVDVIGMLDSPVSVKGRDEPSVAVVKGDARMTDVIARDLSRRIRVPTGSAVVTTAPGSTLRVSAVLEPTDVADCMRPFKDAPYSQGRLNYRQRLIDRVGQVLSESVAGPGRRAGLRPLELNVPQIDAIVERTWPQLSAQAFVAGLLGSLDRLRAASGGSLPDADVSRLHRPPMQRLADEPWSKEDLVLIDAASSLINGPGRTYGHVVVDEAQDLSSMQLLALRRRSTSGSMTVVGDIAQSTGHWARSSWDEVKDVLGQEAEVVDADLPHGYRVPRSIMEMAAKLLPHAAPGISAPIVIRDVEPGPQLHPVSVDGSFFDTTVATIQAHSGLGRFVGVVCPDERVESLGRALDAARISYRNAADGALGTSITVVSPVAAKGLEFDAVVVVDPAAIVAGGPEGYRMLYIALTRTTTYLDIVYPEGSLPEPIRPSVEPEPIGAPSEAVVPTEPEPVPVVVKQEPPTVTPQPSPADHPRPTVGSARPDRSTTSAHQRLLDTHVAVLMEHLDDMVAPKMWRDVLVEALRRMDGDDG